MQQQQQRRSRRQQDFSPNKSLGFAVSPRTCQFADAGLCWGVAVAAAAAQASAAPHAAQWTFSAALQHRSKSQWQQEVKCFGFAAAADAEGDDGVGGP